MKKVKRWRYDCEFCKKTGGSAYHMRKHEQGCTANPNRVCGICRISDREQPTLAELVKLVVVAPCEHVGYCDPDTGAEVDYPFEPWGEITEASLTALRVATDNCPACIHAALKHAKATSNHFNFKTELKEFWAEYNSERAGRGPLLLEEGTWQRSAPHHTWH